MTTIEQHTMNRKRDLAGTNHAGQVAVGCTVCANTFDAGAERARHPAFQPICSPECFADRHQHHHRITAGTDHRGRYVETWTCRCGWFTTAHDRRTLRRRLDLHLDRVGAAA